METMELILKIYILEDAISFTKNIIKKASTNKEIEDKYKEIYTKKENKQPKNNSKIILTPDEVIEAIIENYGKKKKYKTLLTKEDLRNVLNNYIKLYNYELVDFKHIIKRVDEIENIPYYEGIELNVKKIGKKRILTKKEKE